MKTTLLWILLRIRCTWGWHRLKTYKATPYVTQKTVYRRMVVRAAYGKCEICKHPTYSYTPATPRWQRGSKIIHKIQRFIRS